MTNQLQKIDVEDLRLKAINHDIRVAEIIAEKEVAEKKRASILTYKKDLLGKVEEHLEELDRAENAHENLDVFKSELLKRAHDHIEEIERGEHAHEALQNFKMEMLHKITIFKAESFSQ